MADQPTLSLRNVSHTFGEGSSRVDALIDIDLDVQPGEMVAITGRSGSGKSTLLNVAGGLDLPSGGSVKVEGLDLSALKQRELAAMRRRSVGYVFQRLNLVPTLTAIENVALPMELDGVALHEARDAAEEALSRVAMGDHRERYPDQLSGGQQQRVAIARGIAGSRRLMLADEPTGALDELSGEHIMALMRELADGGTSVVIVTHDSALAGWADRVVRLRDGRVDMVTERSVAPSTPADLVP